MKWYQRQPSWNLHSEKTQSAIGLCHAWDWCKIYDEFGPVIFPCYNDRRHMIFIKVEISDPISTSDITVFIFAKSIDMFDKL